MNGPTCDGLCVDSADIGVPGYGVAHPHPGCPLHDPDEVCECGQPDRCLSPTHGQISYPEALKIRHRQKPEEPKGQKFLTLSEALEMRDKQRQPSRPGIPSTPAKAVTSND